MHVAIEEAFLITDLAELLAYLLMFHSEEPSMPTCLYISMAKIATQTMRVMLSFLIHLHENFTLL